MTEKPKIDINSLRIEMREDDLRPEYHYRTYKMFEYCLRDDDRVFKVGSFEEVSDFLYEKFKFFIPDLGMKCPQIIYLKDFLAKHIKEYTGSIYNNRDLLGL